MSNISTDNNVNIVFRHNMKIKSTNETSREEVDKFSIAWFLLTLVNHHIVEKSHHHPLTFTAC